MLKNYNRYRVLKVFLDSPTEPHRLREIARECGLAPLSVKNYLEQLQNENLITKTVKNNNPTYKAQRDGERFKLYKRLSILYELHESGLVDYLWKKLSPEAIILFGSHAKGEGVEDSDIDLAVIGVIQTAEVSRFEKLLDSRVHIVSYKSLTDTTAELRSNILNGIILKGYVEVH